MLLSVEVAGGIEAGVVVPNLKGVVAGFAELVLLLLLLLLPKENSGALGAAVVVFADDSEAEAGVPNENKGFWFDSSAGLDDPKENGAALAPLLFELPEFEAAGKSGVLGAEESLGLNEKVGAAESVDFCVENNEVPVGAGAFVDTSD